MKKLTKTLSLLLVIAMIVSLCVIGVSAKSSDFTDYATVTNKEAFDVMNGIGVISGTTATTINPTGTFTREQAAKIIAYMELGPTYADLYKSTKAPFTDVSTSRWSAGYIAYCANTGIIAGVGDGKFNPTGVLTSTQWAKMLLCALGYDASIDGLTGAGWELNALRLGLSAKLLSADDYNKTFNRDVAILMAFNTLKATMVSHYTSANVTVTGSTESYTISKEAVPVAQGNYTNTMKKDYLQFAEKFFPNLSKDSKTINGVDGYYWNYGDTVKAANYISGFIAVGEKVLATSTDDTTVAKMTTYSTTNAKYVADKADTVAFYINGAPVAAFDKTKTSYAVGDLVVNGNVLYVCKAAVTSAGDFDAAKWTAKDLAGYGVKVDLVDVAVNNVYDGKVDKVYYTTYSVDVLEDAPVVKTNTADGKDYVYIDMAGTDIGSASGYTVKAADVAGYTGLVKGDVVLVNLMADGTYTITKATKTTAQATASNATSITVNGTATKIAANADTSVKTYTQGYYKDVNFYADSYGYLVYAKAVTATVTDYALVTDVTDFTSGLTGQGNYASLVLSNGTVVAKATIAAVDGVKFGASSFVKPSKDTVYGYSANTDGSYNLVTVTSVAKTSIENKQGVSAATGAYKGDNATLYVVQNQTSKVGNGTYTVYTGYTTAPSFTGGKVFYVNDTNGYADIVFVTDYSATSTASDTSVFYLLDTNASTVYDSATESHFEYSALVNGKTVALKVKTADKTLFETNCAAMGLYVYTTADGYVSVVAANPASNVLPMPAKVATYGDTIDTAQGYNKFIYSTTIGKPADNMVSIGGVDYTTTASTYVFVVNADGTYTMGTMSAVVAGTYAGGVTAVTVAENATATAAQQNTLYAIFIQNPAA